MFSQSYRVSAEYQLYPFPVHMFTDMWLILSLKKRVGRVNTGHEVRFCLPDFPRPWRTLKFTRDKEGTWQWRCGDKKNLISVSVLSLFSFNPRKQTRLLRRSEWLKLGNCNWAKKVSSGLLTFVNNFRLALFLLRCLSTLSTQTGLDRILKLVVIGIFVLVVPFFFRNFFPSQSQRQGFSHSVLGSCGKATTDFRLATSKILS